MSSIPQARTLGAAALRICWSSTERPSRIGGSTPRFESAAASASSRTGLRDLSLRMTSIRSCEAMTLRVSLPMMSLSRDWALRSSRSFSK